MMNTSRMHDWTLKSLTFDWINGTGRLIFDGDSSKDISLFAVGIAHFQVPKREEWGPSISVYEVVGPTPLDNGNSSVSIQMQSGDLIEIEAKLFDFSLLEA